MIQKRLPINLTKYIHIHFKQKRKSLINLTMTKLLTNLPIQSKENSFTIHK